jgi:hypothetical protein
VLLDGVAWRVKVGGGGGRKDGFVNRFFNVSRGKIIV